MKEILFVIGSLQSGGAERVASVLTDHWVENGFNVTLVTGTEIFTDFYTVNNKVDRKSLSFDYTSKNLILKCFEQLKRVIKVEKLLWRNNFDVVITSATDISLRFALHFLFRKGKLFICEHNNYDAPKSKLKIFMRNYIFRRATKLFVLTERDRLRYIANGFAEDKLEVMLNPLGVINHMGTNTRNTRSFSYRLLAVARHTEQKSLDRMLEIFALLDERFTLSLAGDGPLKASLERYAAELGINKRVIFLGNVSDIAKLYATHEVLLMTSIYEGLPMVISEANSFGLPVVSFDCPTGPAEMIVDGENGFLVKEDDYSEFVDKVMFIFSSPSVLEKMRHYSIASAKKYSIDEISKKWFSFFNRENN